MLATTALQAATASVAPGNVASCWSGKVVGDGIFLPKSHGRFQPVAAAENWEGGVASSCDRYDLTQALRDPAYQGSARLCGRSALAAVSTNLSLVRSIAWTNSRTR